MKIPRPRPPAGQDRGMPSPAERATAHADVAHAGQVDLDCATCHILAREAGINPAAIRASVLDTYCNRRVEMLDLGVAYIGYCARPANHDGDCHDRII